MRSRIGSCLVAALSLVACWPSKQPVSRAPSPPIATQERARRDSATTLAEAFEAYRAGRRAQREGRTDRAAKSYERAAALLAASTGEPISLSLPNGFRQAPERVGFERDGTLVAAGRFGALRISPDDVWQWAEWTEPPLGHYAIVYLALSPDASQLALTSPWGESGRVFARDTHSGAVTDSFGTDVHFPDFLTWSPDAARVAVAGHSTLQGSDHIGVWNRHAVTREASSLEAPVYALAFSHSGEQLAAGENLDVTLRSAKTGGLLRRGGDGGEELRLNGHGSGVSALAFSPSDEELVTGDNRGDLRLWDVRTGALRQHFEGHRDIVSAIAVSRDGARWLTSSRDGTVALWRPSQSRAERAWKAGESGILDVEFSPDETSVVTCGTDGTIRWWAADDGREQRRVGAVSPASRRVAFIGARKLCVSDGTTSRVLDLERNQLSDPALPRGVTALGALGSERLVIRNRDEEPRLYEGTLVGGAWQSRRTFELDGVGSAFHEAGQPPGPQGVTVSANGTYAGAVVGHALGIWRVRDAKRMLRRFGNVTAAPAFSPDEQRVAWLDELGLSVARVDGALPIVTRSHAALITATKTTRSSREQLSALAFVDDATIELGTHDGNLALLDLASGKVSVDGAFGSSIERVVAGVRTGVLIAVVDDGRVGIRRSRSRPFDFVTRCPVPVDVALSSDDAFVAIACTGSGDDPLHGSVQVWSIATAAPPSLVVALRVLADTDAGILFSSDGHFDFVGRETSRARDALRCHSGPYLLPLDVCEARFRDTQLRALP